MTKPVNRDRQILMADVSFSALGIVSLIGLVMEPFDTTDAVAKVPQPLLVAGITIALMLVIAFLVSKVARLDSQRSEEYTFQLLARGAVVGIMTTLVVNFLWTFDFLLGRWLGDPSPDQIIALLMGGWAIGYFIYRIRGTD